MAYGNKLRSEFILRLSLRFMRPLHLTLGLRMFPSVIFVSAVAKIVLLSNGRAPLAPTPDLALFRKRQPLIDRAHRFDVAFAVLDDLREFAGAVVGVDFGAVEIFFRRRDAQCFR